jgi:hypothetical protein
MSRAAIPDCLGTAKSAGDPYGIARRPACRTGSRNHEEPGRHLSMRSALLTLIAKRVLAPR